MKVHLFKNLIKEAVREVLKEELREILYLANKNSTVTSQSPNSSIQPTINVPRQVNSTGKSGLNEILEMTRNSMTRDDISNFYSGDTTVSFDSSQLPSSPTVGIDITNLDFVSKAASIYKLSNEKDKNR